MKKTSVENLRVKDLKHVLLPLKRGRTLKDYVDVGFDTEFTAEPNSADRELISMQFSLGKGKTAVYYVNKREGVSSEELLEYVLKFLNENGAEPAKHVYLISHFAIAELSKISDFYDEYVKGEFKVRPKVSEFNKAMRWERNFGEITLHIADLFGHMKTSLEKIGATLGYEKLKIEADGKEHAYWITHMKELNEKHREQYEEYAKRDAEITIEAWRKLVETYKPLNLDPHLYTTYTSLAIASFRRGMRTLPCKTTIEKVLIKQKLKGDKWYEHVAKKVVYDDDLNMRVMAALSYWGGNNQAFVRGYYPDIDGTYYDFISLYIIAGILQPLSNEYTNYKRLTPKDVEDGAEGFVNVDFEFPDTEVYPCLPVQEDFYPKLMFPLKGESYCTCTELRQALEQNVNIKSFKGYGFHADENEIQHELKPFLLDMLKKKTELDVSGKAKSIEREIEKSKMVGVIGRLAYMKPSRTAEDITKFLHASGMKSAEFREYGKKKAIRELTERSEVGGTWHIEWATLILGKARSLAAWAVRQGEKCLSISTDGGFWLGNPHFENTELHKQLTEYHSGVRFEGAFSELWIARNRLYVAWKDNGEVLHSAMGGVAVSGTSSEKKVNFEKMIRESLDAGKEVYSEAETKRLTGLNDYMFKATHLNSEEIKTKKISWKPDYKRKLISDVNVFKENTDTKPYETVAEAFRQVYGIKEKAGRLRKLTEVQIQQIKSEPWSLSTRELAKKYGVSESTIKKIRRG
jgi:hypothetical protein